MISPDIQRSVGYHPNTGSNSFDTTGGSSLRATESVNVYERSHGDVHSHNHVIGHRAPGATTWAGVSTCLRTIGPNVAAGRARRLATSRTTNRSLRTNSPLRPYA